MGGEEPIQIFFLELSILVRFEDPKVQDVCLR